MTAFSPLNKLSFTVIFTCILSILSAQEKPLDWYTTNFPKEQAVKLIDETNIVIALDEETGLQIYRNLNDEKILLSNTAGAFTDRQIVYGSFFEISDVSAQVYLPKGSNKFKKKSIKDFRTEKIMSERVFHDDLKAIKFQYPELREGSKIALQYTEAILNPFFLPPVYLQDVFFAEKIKVTVQVPKEVNIKITEHHVDHAKVSYSKQENRGIITHTWELDSVSQFQSEGGAPDPKYYVPHISFTVDSYQKEGKTVPVLQNVSDLYRWYSSLLDSVNNELDPGLIETVDSISKTHTDDLQKAKAIYNWVRSNVKYVAVEDGLGGFIPDNPAAVSRKRFGDCKGMSCLLANLMRHADLNARECWIGTRDIPYTYAENYTPFVDNHMITAFEHNGNWLFLDATDEYVPFGFPSGFIQGKEALIGLENGEYRLANVPVVRAEENVIAISDTLRINQDNLNGSATMNLTGYSSSRFKRLYGKAEKKDRFFKYFLESGNDKFAVIGEPIVKLGDTASSVSYTYELPDYLRAFDDKLFVNLNADRVLANNNLEERNLPLEREYAQTYRFVHHLEVPDGYEILAVPEDFEYATDLATAKIKYTKASNLVSYQLEISIDEIMFQPEQIDDWNDLIKALRNAYRKNVELQKTKND